MAYFVNLVNLVNQKFWNKVFEVVMFDLKDLYLRFEVKDSRYAGFVQLTIRILIW